MDPISELNQLPEPFRSVLGDVRQKLSDRLSRPLPDRLPPSIPDDPPPSIQDMLRQAVPDDLSDPLFDEFSRELLDNLPQDLRDQGLEHEVVDFFRQFFVHVGRLGVLDSLDQSFLDVLRRPQSDALRQSVLDSFPQYMLREWQRSGPKYRNKFSTLKPMFNELWDVSQEVRNILQGLCERDERFSFVNSAVVEFIDGQDGLSQVIDHLDTILSADPTEPRGNSDEVGRMDGLSTILTNANSTRRRDPIENLNFRRVICEIIDSIIFELLNIFEFDITPDQVPAGASESAHLGLLRDLYERSKSLEPRLSNNSSSKTGSEVGVSTDKKHPYLKALDPTTAEIRVLEILPGTEEDPIECHLVVRKLYDDSIPEALSYVWGQVGSVEEISVDKEPFFVTTNLYRILHGLRRPDTTRPIWIDAICINQSDLREKTHQLRFMRDIYLKAEATTIWLSGEQLVDDPTKKRVPDGFNKPLPPGFGGLEIDQYDLATIVNEFRKYPMDGQWTVKQWGLFTMLSRCVGQVQSNEWWERVWTLQEAALPLRAPTFIFRGRSFSFDDIIAAEGFMIKSVALKEHLIDQYMKQRDLLGHEIRHAMYMMGGSTGTVGQTPLLIRLRRGLEQNERDPLLKTFTAVLSFTDAYKATNPKDKIFAIESLLPRCMGRLIYVDYNEECSDVFKRATARSYNFSPSFLLMRSFHFLFESQLRQGKEPTGPSWVLDLSYSDARFCGSDSAKEAAHPVTLDGFLAEGQVRDIEAEKNINTMCFATPTTLFCTGYRIDQISGVGEIPGVGDDESYVDLVRIVLGIYCTRQSVLGLPVPEDYKDRMANDSYMKHEILSWMDLFSLRRGQAVSDQDRNELIKTRNRELAGESFFITKTGIVGISTVPHLKPGDFLSWIIGSPVYSILREAGGQDKVPDDMKKHRIVARAAIDKKPEEITERLKFLPTRHFQIV
ncbi:HET-domain-containing protein [Hypoxylon sp. FL1857]|nr:HET-domain-containing protein [Hypoxylon sp. FL1857]